MKGEKWNLKGDWVSVKPNRLLALLWLRRNHKQHKESTKKEIPTSVSQWCPLLKRQGRLLLLSSGCAIYQWGGMHGNLYWCGSSLARQKHRVYRHLWAQITHGFHSICLLGLGVQVFVFKTVLLGNAVDFQKMFWGRFLSHQDCAPSGDWETLAPKPCFQLPAVRWAFSFLPFPSGDTYPLVGPKTSRSTRSRTRNTTTTVSFFSL